MANKQYSSRMIMMISIVVGIVLAVIIWPLSMIGKGGPTTRTVATRRNCASSRWRAS